MTAFGEAFKAARAAGKTTFKWQGRAYHTKTKDEMEKTMKTVPTPTPRPATNSGPRSSSVDAENAQRGTSQPQQPPTERSSVSLTVAPPKAQTTAQSGSTPPDRRPSAGKSSFLVNRKVEPFKFPISKPKRTRGWADKARQPTDT